MTKKRLITLLESFRDGLDSLSLSQAQMLTIGVQAGIAKNGAFMQVVNGHSVKALDDAIRALAGDDGLDDDAVELTDDEAEITDSVDLATGFTTGTPKQGDPAATWPSGPDAPFEQTCFMPSDVNPVADGQRLPVPSAGPVLRNAGALLAAADSDAAMYLVASSVEQLWKSAYRAPETVDLETSNARENHFEEQVRAAFRAEFDAARSVVPPAGWNFEPLGPGTGIEQPLLMQAHVATQLANRRRIGNWSGTGAGKTVSAILGARLIGAGFGDGVVLVVCPNNTLDGWKSSILNCYPDSSISTGGLNPVWEPGTGPRWMVINFDSLSQPDSAELVDELLGRDDIRLDMVAIDEIHLAKLRGHQGQHSAPTESQRRTNLKTILSRATEQNSDLAVLGMSATPLINDLNEARSVLELISGHDYPDLDTFANTQNCLKMHQQFVLAGTRFMPDYEAELEEVSTVVDCDDLVDEIRELGARPTPSSVEQVLLGAKLPVIVDECLLAKTRGKRSFVYVHYVEGIIDPIRAELEAAGLTVGEFSGDDKSGLARFTGTHSDGAPVPDAQRVDVLIGSSAISTGVDGLQHATDTLVFAVLPWTSAEREQVIGRVHRTGQRSEKVRVVTPVTVAASHMVPGDSGETPWSWCRRRLSILTFKQSVADAVLEGVIAKSLTVSPQKASDAILSWILRLENDGEYVAVRPSNYEMAA
ncbi:MAG TPA: DEAD/DEAH box helicase family protein [Arthrobacter sp.]